MIKVGQIYIDNEGYMSQEGKTIRYRFVITKEYTNPQGKKRYDWIYQTGMVGDYMSEEQIIPNATIVAEYPTWQEAVNSKEFKGGANA